MANYFAGSLHCSMCSYVAESKKGLTGHIVRRHRHEPNFIVYCLETGCNYTTKTWGSFRVHMSRKHKDVEILPDNVLLQESYDQPEGMEVDEDDQQRATESNHQLFIAQYLLNLEAKHKMSQTALNYVVSGTEDFLTKYSTMLQNSIVGALGDQGVNTDVINQIAPDPADIFTEFKTTHLRKKFYSKNCRFIPPVQVLLGMKMMRKNGRIKPVEYSGQVIPFKKSLQALLELSEVQDFLKYPHESQSELMKDVCDGSFVQNHPIFSRDKSALIVMANHDDLELCNPLGVHIKKHKQAAFYYSLGNFPPQYRSQLKSLQLIGLAKSKLVRQFGPSALLKDFLSGIQELKGAGLELQINGKLRKFSGDLVMVPCDTPAAAWLGGFKEGVGKAKKGCRTCEATQIEMRTMFSPHDFLLRNPQEHLERCAALEELSKKSKKHWSKFWGVNGRSPLLQVTSNISDLLPHDPMHVLLEGVVPYEAALCLYQFIYVKKYFTLNWLNTCILNFSYQGTDKSQRPEKIEVQQLTSAFKLKQKSAGMLTLCFALPLMISSKIPDDDKHYKNLIRLFQVVQLGTCPYATLDTAGELEQLIATHHLTFVELYPKHSVPPKFHYLVHFPRQIVLFGPLRAQWVMRYEAKNGWFTNYNWKCFKNLEYSMAYKHQLAMCSEMLGIDGNSSTNFAYSGDIVGEGSVVNFSDLEMSHLEHDFRSKCHSLHIPLPFPLTVYQSREINIHGNTYVTGSCLLLRWEDNIPEFCIIRNIVVVDGRKFFLCETLKTVLFHWKLNAYEVATDNTLENCVIHHLDLENTFPLHIVLIQGKKCIVNRYCHFTEYID